MSNSIQDQLADYAPLNNGPKPRPMPGSYYLQMPPQIEVKEVSFPGGDSGIEFNLGGTTIASDANGDQTFLGEELNRFYTVNTIPRKGQRWSDGLDFLRHFNLDLSDFAMNPTVENAKALAQQIQGQRTPNPVFLTYNGKDKVEKGNKKKYYLQAKDFIKADGTYAKVGYKVGGESGTGKGGTLMTEPEIPVEVTNQGRQAERDFLKQYPVVYANLEPGYRGWVERAEK